MFAVYDRSVVYIYDLVRVECGSYFYGVCPTHYMPKGLIVYFLVAADLR